MARSARNAAYFARRCRSQDSITPITDAMQNNTPIKSPNCMAVSSGFPSVNISRPKRRAIPMDRAPPPRNARRNETDWEGKPPCALAVRRMYPKEMIQPISSAPFKASFQKRNNGRMPKEVGKTSSTISMAIMTRAPLHRRSESQKKRDGNLCILLFFVLTQ